MARRLALVLVAALAVSAGCSSAPPPPEGRLNIETVAKWRTLYLARHNRKPPADEAEFVKFIQQELQSRGDQIDPDTFFVSPRDNKRFVVMYGPESAKLKESDIAVHEQEGYDGKVLVAYENGRSAEIEAGELQSLLAAQK